MIAVIAISTPAFSALFKQQDKTSNSTTFENKKITLNPKLLSLEPNRWTKLHTPYSSNWRRQAHAGMAYDSKRGTLLIFGSNTHGKNWDNAVHEFDPVKEEWHTHYPHAPKETYRADRMGRAISGKDDILPWAMHTYGNIIYDPKLDALVVNALPEHNYIKKKIPAVKIHPTWIYDLETHKWSIFPNDRKSYPRFFAGASTYDEARDTIISYNNGIWELGPERDAWKKIGNWREVVDHHSAYDSKRRNFAVFGNHGNSSRVWVYSPGKKAGIEGTWKENIPTGDYCPPGQAFPVAFDREHGVFLLVVNNNIVFEDKLGRKRWGRAKAAHTIIYDPETNKYHRLPAADLPPIRMNYMMAYDRKHKVFLLVTGAHKKPPTVWALKLDQ